MTQFSVQWILSLNRLSQNRGQVQFGSPDNVSQPSVEAVQEFTANVLAARPEFGGIGTITTATTSGTNQVHGSAFWSPCKSSYVQPHSTGWIRPNSPIPCTGDELPQV